MSADQILTYARDLSGGGVERALLRLAGGWAAAGRRVTLMLGDASGPLAAEVPAGVEVVEVGSGSMRALAAAVPRSVRSLRPDVIFCPGNHYTSVAAWTWARLGRDCPPIVGKMSNAVYRGDHGALLDAGQRHDLAALRLLERTVLVARTLRVGGCQNDARSQRGKEEVSGNRHTHIPYNRPPSYTRAIE